MAAVLDAFWNVRDNDSISGVWHPHYNKIVWHQDRAELTVTLKSVFLAGDWGAPTSPAARPRPPIPPSSLTY